MTYSVDIATNLQSVADVISLKKYLSSPTGLQVMRGTQVSNNGSLLELTPDEASVAELSVACPASSDSPVGKALLLPARMGPYNPRWTVGLWQRSGYVKGYYGSGTDRYTQLGVDDDGLVYVPLYPARIDGATRVQVGSPVTASGAGAEELFINVIHVDESPHIWHVEVNNPSASSVSVTLNQSMALPGFTLSVRELTLGAGAVKVLM